jgi:hypothetical protein
VAAAAAAAGSGACAAIVGGSPFLLAAFLTIDFTVFLLNSTQEGNVDVTL